METLVAILEGWWGVWVWIFTGSAPAIPSADGAHWLLRFGIGLIYLATNLRFLELVLDPFGNPRKRGILDEQLPYGRNETLGMHLVHQDDKK